MGVSWDGMFLIIWYQLLGVTILRPSSPARATIINQGDPSIIGEIKKCTTKKGFDAPKKRYVKKRRRK
jgi:hypothetical protein